jgi:hypothetical protein
MTIETANYPINHITAIEDRIDTILRRVVGEYEVLAQAKAKPALISDNYFTELAQNFVEDVACIEIYTKQFNK